MGSSPVGDAKEALYWNDGDMIGFASLVLNSSSGAGSDEAGKERIVEALCGALTTAAPMSSLTLTQALRAIAQHGAWRVANGHFVN